jgi:hypothetical protein
MMPEISSY